MSSNNRGKIAFMAGTLLFLLSIDRLSKAWVQANMELGTSLPIIPDLLKFSYFVNRGAASGFGQDSPLTAPLLAWAGLAFIPAMLAFYWFYTKAWGESFWIRAFLVTGLAAMISTVFDRLHYGYVVDFIAVRSLPIFNVADLLPPIGALALMVELVTNRSKLADQLQVREGDYDSFPLGRLDLSD